MTKPRFSFRVPLDLQANIDLDPYLRERGLVLAEKRFVDALSWSIGQVLRAATSAAVLVTDSEALEVFLDELDAELAELAENCSEDFAETGTAVLNGVREGLREARDTAPA